MHEGDYLAITYKEERTARRALKFGESLSGLRLNSACFSCVAWVFITAWHCESQEQRARALHCGSMRGRAHLRMECHGSAVR
jgi:hypothetical protein